MKWDKIDRYHMTSGQWSLTWAASPVPKPFGLFLSGKLMGHFKTHHEAAKAAETGPSVESQTEAAQTGELYEQA